MEPNDGTDKGRRRLLIATAGVGGAGLVASAIPFIESMGPSEAAKAAGAPVEADIGSLAPGRMTTVEFRGKPVWIVHRTGQMLQSLPKVEPRLADPNSEQPQQPPYTKNPTRSIRPPFFIVTGLCTHLGCIPLFRPEPGADDVGPDWVGGFYCPCHGSKFDLAGRVLQNVPAPLNMEIPRHMYLSETRVLIGADNLKG